MTEVVDSRPKVVILSGQTNLLQYTSNGTLHVSSWVKPNYKMGEVVKGASSKIVTFAKEDCLVFIGGNLRFTTL